MSWAATQLSGLAAKHTNAAVAATTSMLIFLGISDDVIKRPFFCGTEWPRLADFNCVSKRRLWQGLRDKLGSQRSLAGLFFEKNETSQCKRATAVVVGQWKYTADDFRTFITGSIQCISASQSIRKLTASCSHRGASPCGGRIPPYLPHHGN